MLLVVCNNTSWPQNNGVVLDFFLQYDIASILKTLDIGCDELPVQINLGLLWNTNNDLFTFKNSHRQQIVHKRGILSAINIIFDPMIFASPVVITGRLIMKHIMSTL